MQWNLHLAGESVETELNDVLQELITKLEDIGHHLTQATLTTDAGPKQLPTQPVPAEPEQTIAGEPVVPTQPGTAPVDSNLSPEPGEIVAPIGSPVGATTIAQVETDTPPSLGTEPASV
jgi:hypothetical protein